MRSIVSGFCVKLCAIVLLCVIGAAGRADATALDGACCQPNGACTIELSFDCEATGGIYAGDGVSCDAVQCESQVAVPVFSFLGFVGLVGALGGLGLFQLIRRRRA